MPQNISRATKTRSKPTFHFTPIHSRLIAMSSKNVFLKYEELKPKDSGKSSTKPSDPHKLQETLNRIFPLLDTAKGKLQVSTKEAAIFEILDLEHAVDCKLQELKDETPWFSSETGHVHEQLFQELIRQEIIVCPERGLLMKMVFDEASTAVVALGKCCRSLFSNAVCRRLLCRRCVLSMREEIPKLEKRLQEAQNLAEGMQREWKESRRRKDDAERVKRIERDFLENQLEKANREMVKQIEDIIDEEHRWLK